jgi:hypothetical protein
MGWFGVAIATLSHEQIRPWVYGLFRGFFVSFQDISHCLGLLFTSYEKEKTVVREKGVEI